MQLVKVGLVYLGAFDAVASSGVRIYKPKVFAQLRHFSERIALVSHSLPKKVLGLRRIGTSKGIVQRQLIFFWLVGSIVMTYC